MEVCHNCIAERRTSLGKAYMCSNHAEMKLELDLNRLRLLRNAGQQGPKDNF